MSLCTAQRKKISEGWLGLVPLMTNGMGVFGRSRVPLSRPPLGGPLGGPSGRGPRRGGISLPTGAGSGAAGGEESGSVSGARRPMTFPRGRPSPHSVGLRLVQFPSSLGG